MPTLKNGHEMRDHLLKNKELEIPGIGILTLYTINQYLGPNEGIIHPPYQKIRFEESNFGRKKNRIFKNYFKLKRSKSLKSKLEDVTNEILNFGCSDLQGLGKFERDEKGILGFKPYNLLNQDKKYLPVIDLERMSAQFSFNSINKKSKGIGSEKSNTFSLLNNTENKSGSKFRTEGEAESGFNPMMLTRSPQSMTGFKTPWMSYAFIGSVLLFSGLILAIS